MPKFGTFTFSGVNVDMAGTTNPGDRDRQERMPVFVIAKDYAGSSTLRSAIAGMGS